MRADDAETIARRAFSEIAARFPSLHIVENVNDPVEISLTIHLNRNVYITFGFACKI